MEKISSIVPKSQRVQAVDLNSAQPVRPGAPAFGRPMGTSTAGVRDQMSTAQRAVAEQNRLVDKRAEHMSQMVEEMNNRFFLQKEIPATARPVDELNIHFPPPRPGSGQSEGDFGPVAKRFESDDFALEAAVNRDESELSESSEPTEAKEREYVPLGSYLDVSV